MENTRIATEQKLREEQQEMLRREQRTKEEQERILSTEQMQALLAGASETLLVAAKSLDKKPVFTPPYMDVYKVEDGTRKAISIEKMKEEVEQAKDEGRDTGVYQLVVRGTNKGITISEARDVYYNEENGNFAVFTEEKAITNMSRDMVKDMVQSVEDVLENIGYYIREFERMYPNEQPVPNFDEKEFKDSINSYSMDELTTISTMGREVDRRHREVDENVEDMEMIPEYNYSAT